MSSYNALNKWHIHWLITNDNIFPLNKLLFILLLLIENIRTRYSSLCRQMLRGIPKRLINFTFSLHYVGCFHHNAPKNHLKGGKKQFAHMAIRWQHIHTASSLSGVSWQFLFHYSFPLWKFNTFRPTIHFSESAFSTRTP